MRNFKYSVALDVDDVLMPCVSLACKMVNEKYGTNLQESDITQWEVGETEYGEKLQEFFQDPEFYKHQVPYEGSQEFVRKLSRKMEIFIVTAVPANVISTRIAQIKKYFPQIETENIIPASRKDVINVDFALDDRSHNILTSNAKYPVLFRRPWNQNITGVLSVQSYDEFLNIIDCVKTSYAEPFIGFSRPTVLALVGPSGSGKTTILDELIKNEKIDKPVSATTRKRRIKTTTRQASLRRAEYETISTCTMHNRYGKKCPTYYVSCPTIWRLTRGTRKASCISSQRLMV